MNLAKRDVFHDDMSFAGRIDGDVALMGGIKAGDVEGRRREGRATVGGSQHPELRLGLVVAGREEHEHYAARGGDADVEKAMRQSDSKDGPAAGPVAK
jgi:hypothetical protein